jgi:hypothetical protein
LSVSQATGAPNTFTCSDSRQAWASANANGVDTLTLGFEIPVYPTLVNIYETYNPGSITSIDLIPADDSAPIPVANSGDNGFKTCPGVFTIKIVNVNKPIGSIAIHLDQSKANKWDEIDAVELIGTANKVSSSISPATSSATLAATMVATKSTTP